MTPSSSLHWALGMHVLQRHTLVGQNTHSHNFFYRPLRVFPGGRRSSLLPASNRSFAHSLSPAYAPPKLLTETMVPSKSSGTLTSELQGRNCHSLGSDEEPTSFTLSCDSSKWHSSQEETSILNAPTPIITLISKNIQSRL